MRVPQEVHGLLGPFVFGDSTRMKTIRESNYSALVHEVCDLNGKLDIRNRLWYLTLLIKALVTSRSSFLMSSYLIRVRCYLRPTPFAVRNWNRL